MDRLLCSEEELAQDILEVITLFSARPYDARSHEYKKLMDALADQETVQRARGQLNLL